jgi:hypothetical protein
MAQSQPAQTFFPEWVIGEFRDENAALITHYHILHQPDPVYKYADLPPCLY